MILLQTTPEELECGACPHCGTKVFISCTPIINTLPKLRMLLNGTLNTCACDGCGDPVTAEDPVLINLEHHGLEQMFYMPLSYLESGYMDRPLSQIWSIRNISTTTSTNSSAKFEHAS